MELKRIKKELLVITPEINCNAWAIDKTNLYNITAVITGPENSPYEDGLFFLNIQLPADFPYQPPKLRFYTKIYHPCITENGVLCWGQERKLYPSPAYSLGQYLESIRYMLKDFIPWCRHNADAIKSLENDRELFEATAREWTRRYAM